MNTEYSKSSEKVCDELLIAAKKENLEQVKALLKQDQNLNFENGLTALQLAAKSLHLKAVKTLLEAGAFFNLENNAGDTALTPVEKLCCEKIVDFLLEKLKEINNLNSSEQKILQQLLNKEILTKLLKKAVSQRVLKKETVQQLLFNASEEGNLELALTLLKTGAKVNMVGDKGYTPLVCAAGRGHIQVVKALVKAGSDIEYKIGIGSGGALDFAYHRGHIDVGDYLSKKLKEIKIPKSLEKKMHARLLKVAKKDNLQLLQKLLKTSTDANFKNNKGLTVLMCAAKEGRVPMVIILLQADVDIDVATDEYDVTALMFAAKNGHDEVVRILVNNDADINLNNYYGNNALMCALCGKSIREKNSILAAGTKFVKKIGHDNAIVRRMAQNSYEKIVRFLVHKGANIYSQNTKGNNALMIALSNNDLASAHILLGDFQNNDYKAALMPAKKEVKGEFVHHFVQEFSNAINQNKKYENITLPNNNIVATEAELDQQNEFGDSALIIAARNGYEHIVNLLLNKGANPNLQNSYKDTALVVAARNRNEHIVNLLLNKSANLNLKNNDGDTALIIATRNNNKHVVELLLNKGSDPNLKNNDGDTALIIATRNGNEHMVELLLNRGANPNLQNNDGDTALIIATKNINNNIVKLLLNTDTINTNIQNKNYDTALMIALYNKKTMITSYDKKTMIVLHNKKNKLINALMSAKNNVDLQNRQDYTALAIAAEAGFEKIVNSLIGNGAKIDLQNYFKDTALTLAVKNNHIASARALLTAGALVDLKNKNSDTALMIAIDKNNKQIQTLLLNDNSCKTVAPATGKKSNKLTQDLPPLLLNNNSCKIVEPTTGKESNKLTQGLSQAMATVGKQSSTAGSTQIHRVLEGVTSFFSGVTSLLPRRRY